MTSSLTATACRVLSTPDAAAKARRSRAGAAAWRLGRITALGDARPPDRPARPSDPLLRAPRDMPKRGKGKSRAERIALLHALAHIEFNAVDLAWDIIARFNDQSLPPEFFDDWVRVADEEAKHFLLLRVRLADFGSDYGRLPAHGGLWQAAAATADDLLARLAIVPMVLEARGLDVAPTMIARMKAIGDTRTESILEEIYRDEIDHVAIGRNWFLYLCSERGLPPIPTWQTLVQRRFKGRLKAPFNHQARELAGMSAAYYEPIAVASGGMPPSTRCASAASRN